MGKSVLLIVVDQWRGDTLAHLGHPHVKTPNISRLAARGTTFRNHYCQGVPCGPARASLLTGTYLMTHRVVRNGAPLDAMLTTLPRELRRAGYDPALTGYTTTTPDPRFTAATDPRYRSNGDLMDDWRVLRSLTPNKDPYFSWLRQLGYAVPENQEDLWSPELRAESVEGRLDLPSLIMSQHSDTAWMTDGALDYLRHARGRPWFLHYGLYRPHPPFCASEEYLKLYDAAALDGPVRAGDRAAEAQQHPLLRMLLDRINQKKFMQNREGPAAALDESEIRQVRAHYYGLITEADHNIGRVLDELEESGEIDNTLIVFTCDHGEQLGDHHLLGKTGYFRESYHIPLIVCDPAGDPAQRGAVVEAFTESVDVMPTILEWLGQPVPRQCDGRSLLPFCAGEQPERWRDGVLYEFDFRDVLDPSVEQRLGIEMDACNLAVYQTERWKYVHFAALPPLLFDLENDPHELDNLAGDPAFAEFVAEMAQRMLSRRLAHANRSLTGYFAEGGLHHRVGGVAMPVGEREHLPRAAE
ncbi:alkaline phosphatase family protein [Pelagibius sp.]|uniref:alkaline phosphatase family protein n=1 Tax=Pelagibius sp. TaxID=1931238 RepID=UPI00261C09EC|nr:alkaline phosphatase family protein [Pelagibius sp.]